MGRARIGSTIAVAYPGAAWLENTTEVPPLVLVGEDCRARHYPRGAESALQSLAGCQRIYADALQDRQFEIEAGLPGPSDLDCLRTAARLLDENAPNDLASIAARISPSLQDTRAGNRSALGPAGALCDRARLLRAVWDAGQFRERLADEGLTQVYRQIELPVIEPTLSMMNAGVGVDWELLDRRRQEHENGRLETSKKIEAQTGHTLNLDAHQEVEHLLYDVLGLPCPTRTLAIVAG